MIMPTADNKDLNQPKLQSSTYFWCHLCKSEEKKEDKGCRWCKSEEEKEEDKKCRCRGFYPLIEKSVYFDNTKLRDIFLKILMHCNEFSLTDLTKDIEDM